MYVFMYNVDKGLAFLWKPLSGGCVSDVLTWDELGNLTDQRILVPLCHDNEENDRAWWNCIAVKYLQQNMVVWDGLEVYECQLEFEEFCNVIEF